MSETALSPVCQFVAVDETRPHPQALARLTGGECPLCPVSHALPADEDWITHLTTAHSPAQVAHGLLVAAAKLHQTGMEAERLVRQFDAANDRVDKIVAVNGEAR